jgi:16S rRNA C967 or C1407 C5-methylase (RsmB/RsmF family)
VDIWGKWHSAMGTSMHKLQLAVAVQCARQLATGGRMVYSTCSLNPVEDEAVVAELLRRAEGKLELLDVSNELPSLKRTAGVTSWRLRDKVCGVCVYVRVAD